MGSVNTSQIGPNNGVDLNLISGPGGYVYVNGQIITGSGSVIIGPQGDMGPTGSIGNTGATGATGPKGDKGDQGIPGIDGSVLPAGLTWSGNWNGTQSYLKNYVVGYASASWWSKNDIEGKPFPLTPNSPPDIDTNNWALLATKGPIGRQGSIGPQGPQGPTGIQGIPGPIGPGIASQVSYKDTNVEVALDNIKTTFENFESNITSGNGSFVTLSSTYSNFISLNTSSLTSSSIQFSGLTNSGLLSWNNTDGTADLTLKGGNVTLQLGQEQVLRVLNNTLSNITLLESNYQAVRVTGSQGNRLKVDLAQATTDAFSAETIGLVTETINNNEEGFITTSGLVRNINTTGSIQGETWSNGDILYLSPFVSGQLTNIKPSAPNHLVVIGYIVRAHITQGKIFVKVDNGYELDELHNVKIVGTPSNGDVLVYNATMSLWENKTLSVNSDVYEFMHFYIRGTIPYNANPDLEPFPVRGDRDIGQLGYPGDFWNRVTSTTSDYRGTAQSIFKASNLVEVMVNNSSVSADLQIRVVAFDVSLTGNGAISNPRSLAVKIIPQGQLKHTIFLPNEIDSTNVININTMISITATVKSGTESVNMDRCYISLKFKNI